MSNLGAREWSSLPLRIFWALNCVTWARVSPWPQGPLPLGFLELLLCPSPYVSFYFSGSKKLSQKRGTSPAGAAAQPRCSLCALLAPREVSRCSRGRRSCGCFSQGPATPCSCWKGLWAARLERSRSPVAAPRPAREPCGRGPRCARPARGAPLPPSRERAGSGLRSPRGPRRWRRAPPGSLLARGSHSLCGLSPRFSCPGGRDSRAPHRAFAVGGSPVRCQVQPTRGRLSPACALLLQWGRGVKKGHLALSH